jgi:light-regulated signal transduction histidine kinase (bacteriophytochrome)
MAPRPDSQPRDVAEERARTLASGLAEFCGRAGHDLVGPLNQAGSLLALFVQQRKNSPDAEANVLLDFLQVSSIKMQAVVAAVQQFTRIAADTNRFEMVDLNAALANARLRIEKPIAENAATIIHDALPVITANGDQISTLFEILITNAIRFRRREEPPVIRVSAKQSGEAWLLTVADNGIGIDPEYREVVFQPFRRLHGKEFPGAGIGLAAAKLIVGLHGGEIRVEPASGAGTAVLCTIPAAIGG